MRVQFIFICACLLFHVAAGGQEKMNPDALPLTIAEICNSDAKAVCRRKELTQKRREDNLKSFIGKFRKMYDDVTKDVYKKMPLKMSDKGGDINLKNTGNNFEIENRVRKKYYDMFGDMEKDYIEPLIKRAKTLQQKVIDDMRPSHTSMQGALDTMGMDLANVVPLTMSKMNKDYNDWTAKHASSINLQKLTDPKFEDHFLKDLNTFFGSKEDPPVIDYCTIDDIEPKKDCGCDELLNKILSKDLKTETIIEEIKGKRPSKIFDHDVYGKRIERLEKESQYSDNSQTLSAPVHPGDSLLKSILLKDTTGPCSLHPQIDNANNMATRAQYCKLRSELFSDINLKQGFLDLAKIRFEKETWLRGCGSSGLRGNAFHFSFSSAEFLKVDANKSSDIKDEFREITVCPGFILKSAPWNDSEDQMKKLVNIVTHELGHENDYTYAHDLFNPIIACYGDKYKFDNDGDKREFTADLYGAETTAQYLARLKSNDAELPAKKAEILEFALAELCYDDRRVEGDTHQSNRHRIELTLSNTSIRAVFGCTNENSMNMAGCGMMARSAMSFDLHDIIKDRNKTDANENSSNMKYIEDHRQEFKKNAPKAKTVY